MIRSQLSSSQPPERDKAMKPESQCNIENTEATEITVHFDQEPASYNENKPDEGPEECDELVECPNTLNKTAKNEVVLHDQTLTKVQVSTPIPQDLFYTNLACENVLGRLRIYEIKHAKPPNSQWSSKHATLNKAEWSTTPLSLEKTALTTKPGLYEWLFMKFGLTTAPRQISRHQNQVLSFYGDQVIFANNSPMFGAPLNLAFKPLQTDGLIVNTMKCIFITNGSTFLSCENNDQVKTKPLVAVIQRSMPFEPGDWFPIKDPPHHTNESSGKTKLNFTFEVANLVCLVAVKSILRSKPLQAGGDDAGLRSTIRFTEPIPASIVDQHARPPDNNTLMIHGPVTHPHDGPVHRSTSPFNDPVRLPEETIRTPYKPVRPPDGLSADSQVLKTIHQFQLSMGLQFLALVRSYPPSHIQAQSRYPSHIEVAQRSFPYW